MFSRSVQGRTQVDERSNARRLKRQVAGIGPDPVENKIVQVGDVIDGFRIDGLEFFHGLNDRGQIVFTAFNQNGLQRVYCADPHR